MRLNASSADAFFEAAATSSGGQSSPPEPPVRSRQQIDLEPLYRKQAPRLKRFFARRIGVEEAHDLVHECFVGLLRALGRPAIFLERPSGTFELRRGFAIEPGSKVLMVEDVVTTGLSSREAIAAVEAAGGEVIAEAALVDRSGGDANLGAPFHPLIRIDVPTYEADSIPPELAAIPAIKPGSRAAA